MGHTVVHSIGFQAEINGIWPNQMVLGHFLTESHHRDCVFLLESGRSDTACPKQLARAQTTCHLNHTPQRVDHPTTALLTPLR